MKILQQNLNRSTFFVWKLKRNVSVVRFKFRCNILISGKIIKEMPGFGSEWETLYKSNMELKLHDILYPDICGNDIIFGLKWIGRSSIHSS